MSLNNGALLIPGLILSVAGVACAQQAPPEPALIPCGEQRGIEVVCGVKAPEDLELTPDGKYLIVSQYASFRTRGSTEDLLLFDLATKKTSKLPVTVEPTRGWGDPACVPANGLQSHGTSLARRNGGAWQLFVVNHGGRQSIEMYELKKAGSNWGLIWRGCVVSDKDFNDVAALADGSFVGTHPTAVNQARPPGTPAPQGDPFAQRETGWVAKWTAAGGETEVPGTRLGYPNGVNASADGKYLYINAFGSKEVAKYDVKAAKVIGTAKVDFMPDNLTWTKKGQLIAAGVKGARGNCPATSSTPCVDAFGVAMIDPEKMQGRTIFDSEARRMISGVSVAIEAGNDLYIGAFQGDRLVRIPIKDLGH